MTYTIIIADAVSKSISKFSTLNTYQLGGHVANLDFWVAQVKNAIEVLDGYSRRHKQMQLAQKEYIAQHDTRNFTASESLLHREFPYEPLYDLASADTDRPSIDSETIKLKRRELVDNFYSFLKRCHKERVLDSAKARKALSDCNIGVEPGDFQVD
jgi:hypothetical protein